MGSDVANRQELVGHGFGAFRPVCRFQRVQAFAEHATTIPIAR